MASNYIALLRPRILAAFPPWGSSEGASRVALAGAKVGKEFKWMSGNKIQKEWEEIHSMTIQNALVPKSWLDPHLFFYVPLATFQIKADGFCTPKKTSV